MKHAADLRARRARRLSLALLLLVLVAVGATSEAPTATTPVLDESALMQATLDGPSLDGVAPATIEQLQARVAAVLEREGVPGVGLALVDRDGLRWAGGVGVADLKTGRPVDADTQFRVASITKSVVALGVMRLVEQGRLDLDQPLRERMPGVVPPGAWDGAAAVTLAHALEHTAGFDDMRFNEWFADEGLAPRDALAINPRSRVARWRPGSRMSYSNPGYTIAGHAIELATGEAWDHYLEREVLRPLGMPTARFRRDPEFADRLATGHVGPGEPAVFRPIAHAPAGALLSSPRELAGLVRFWLRRGEDAAIVGPDALARIERTATLPYRGPDTNYGLGNYGDVLHPVRGRGHDGGLPGFLSCYRYFPDLGVGYVMLLNATHSLRAYVEIRALLFAHLTAGMRPLPRPPSAEPDPEAIAAATGYYAYANPRNELFGFIQRATIGFRVRPDPAGIELEALLGGDTVPLVPTGDGGYRHALEGGTSIRLATDADGRRILAGGMAYLEAGSYAWARGRLLALQGALALIQLAPLWALGWALVAGIRRLRGRPPAPGEVALHVWPAAAGLAFMATPLLLLELLRREAFTAANPLSIGLCLCTLVFAACSAAAVAEAVRAAVGRSLPLAARLVPSAAACACFGMTLYLLWHGIIGLRIWAW